MTRINPASGFPGTELELDLLTLVVRLEQLNRDDPPDHWLWADRIIGCDVARMRRKWISRAVQDWAERPIGDGRSRPDPPDRGRGYRAGYVTSAAPTAEIYRGIGQGQTLPPPQAR